MTTEETIRDFIEFINEFHSVELTQYNPYEDYDGMMHESYDRIGHDWQEELIHAYVNYITHDRKIEYAR